MNVVVIVSGGLAEVLQAVPLLQTLRQVPEAHITLAGPAEGEAVIGRLPALDDILVLPGMARGGRAGSGAAAWFELRRRRFDIAVVCSRRARDAMLVYAAGIPRRLGVHQRLAAPFLSESVRVSPTVNNADAWRRLASLLGISAPPDEPSFAVSPSERERVDALLSTAAIEPERMLVAIAPGRGDGDDIAGAEIGLLWTPERYAHLANQLAIRHGAAVVVVGPEPDRPAVDEMLADLGAPYVDLCGELSVGETAALLGRCDLVVAGDSPLLALASVLGTPAVGLFGPTDGHRRGPFGPSHRVVQALPDRADLLGRRSGRVDRIRVEDVLAGIESAL